ncbi:MAG: hypothetical protein HY917_02200, partial [Candidatus Diapherotrites archaeon]|nr:hypothetical protein [Candidatus Diapherotrites archaeon]
MNSKPLFVLLSALIGMGFLLSSFAQEPAGALPGSDSSGGPGFDFGVPEFSSADPEYVAQEKMTENMTVAYNWIAENSLQFVQGCKTGREELIGQLSAVMAQSQETSGLCTRLEADARACNPEQFCSGFSQGKLPLPPQARTALKKAGIDSQTLTVAQMTPELVEKICLGQTDSMQEEQNQRMQKTKEKLSAQLPTFRQKCEEMKQWRENEDMQIRLPEFGPFPQNRPQEQRPFNPSQPREPYRPPESFGVCSGSPPTCSEGQSAECQNGGWNCRSFPGPEHPIEPAPPQEGARQTSSNPAPPAPETPPAEQPAPPPAESPPPAETPPAPEPVSTSPLKKSGRIFTRAILEGEPAPEAPPASEPAPPQEVREPEPGLDQLPQQGNYGNGPPQGNPYGPPQGFGDYGRGPPNPNGYGPPQGYESGPPGQYGPPQGPQGYGMGPPPGQYGSMPQAYNGGPPQGQG